MIASRFAPSFDTLIKIGVILIAVVLASVLSVAGAAIHPLVGFGAIIGVIAALAILVQPTLGLLAFVLTVTLLPFAVIPVPIGGVRLTFVDGILSAVLLVWLARLLTRRQERLISSAVDGPILLFLGLAIVSYILGIQSTSAEVTRFFLKTINSILFFFVASNLIHDRRTLRLVVQTIAVGALGASVIAIILYLLPADLVTRILGGLRALGYYPAGGPVVRTIAESQLVRAIGTSVDPNVLAGTLLLTVPYAITQLFSRVPIFPRKYLWPASGINRMA